MELRLKSWKIIGEKNCQKKDNWFHSQIYYSLRPDECHLFMRNGLFKSLHNELNAPKINTLNGYQRVN